MQTAADCSRTHLNSIALTLAFNHKAKSENKGTRLNAYSSMTWQSSTYISESLRLVKPTYMKDTKAYMLQTAFKSRDHYAQAKIMHQTVDPDFVDSSPGHQQAMHVSLSSSAKEDTRIRKRRFYTGHITTPEATGSPRR